MTTVAIELKTSCAQCGADVPINAMVGDVWCKKCGEVTHVGGELWKRLMLAPALDGPQSEPGSKREDMFDSQRALVRTFMRKDATCGRCGGAMDQNEVPEGVKRGWIACRQCGDHASVRTLPFGLEGLGGITCLIAEDLAQVEARGPASAEANPVPADVHCPSCGAVVSLDVTSERSVHCSFCNGSIVIPDTIWDKLHPMPVHRTWYLWRDPAADPIGASVEPFKWDYVNDVVIDAQGRAYFVGKPMRDGHGQVAWCCDEMTLETFWVSGELPLKADRGMLALATDGHLLVCGGTHVLVKLSCEDGSTAATIGDREPDDAKTPHLDLEDCNSFAADVDGTLLVMIGTSWGQKRLIRFDADGNAKATWPSRSSWFGGSDPKLAPIYERDYRGNRGLPEIKDSNSVSRLGSKPNTLFDACSMYVDGSGMLYLVSKDAMAKLDREGKVVWRTRLPGKADVCCRPCSDRNGNVYVLRTQGGTRSICRISADGRKVEKIVDSRSVMTPIVHDNLLAVLPDGTMLVFGPTASARVFAPDGTLRLANSGARAHDAICASKSDK